MKTFPKTVRVSELTYEEADLLLKLIDGSQSKFKWLAKELEDGLKPIYVYKVHCTECSRVYEITRGKPVPKALLAKGGVCVNCSDDFK